MYGTVIAVARSLYQSINREEIMQKVLFNERGFTIRRVDPNECSGAEIQFIVVSGGDSAERFFTDPQELTRLLAQMSIAVMSEFRAGPQAR